MGGCTIHCNTAYPLWVGGVQVTEDNQNDILNDGGSAKFEVRDGENILTLDNATITGTYTDEDDNSYNIYSIRRRRNSY